MGIIHGFYIDSLPHLQFYEIVSMTAFLLQSMAFGTFSNMQYCFEYFWSYNHEFPTVLNSN